MDGNNFQNNCDIINIEKKDTFKFIWCKFRKIKNLGKVHFKLMPMKKIIYYLWQERCNL